MPECVTCECVSKLTWDLKRNPSTFSACMWSNLATYEDVWTLEKGRWKLVRYSKVHGLISPARSGCSVRRVIRFVIQFCVMRSVRGIRLSVWSLKLIQYFQTLRNKLCIWWGYCSHILLPRQIRVRSLCLAFWPGKRDKLVKQWLFNETPGHLTGSYLKELAVHWRSDQYEREWKAKSTLFFAAHRSCCRGFCRAVGGFVASGTTASCVQYTDNRCHMYPFR